MVQNTPCMLLHEKCAEGRPPVPHALLSSLQRKKLTLSHCHCPWNAMAQVMVRQQAVTEGQAQEPMILLIVEPGRIPQAWELASAVHRYAPFVVCWIFEAEAAPRLRQYRADEVGERMTPEPKPRAMRRAEPRLVVDEAEDEGRRPGVPVRVGGDTPSLTAAELQMLLTGEAPLDVARPGQGRGRP